MKTDAASLLVHTDTFEKLKQSLESIPALPTILGIPIFACDFVPPNVGLTRDETGMITGIIKLDAKP